MNFPRINSLSVALIVALFAAALLTRPTFAAGPSTRPADTKSSADDLLVLKPVKDQKSGVEFRVPKGWKLNSDTTQDISYKAPTKDNVTEGSLAANFNISKADVPGIKPADVTEIIKGKRAQYGKILKDYQDVKDSTPAPKFPGRGVGVINYTWKAQYTVPVRGLQVWIVDTDKIYLVTCTTLTDAFPKREKALRAMIKSIVLP